MVEEVQGHRQLEGRSPTPRPLPKIGTEQAEELSFPVPNTTLVQAMSLENAAAGDGHDRNWIGWAELENDPLIFNSLLLDWGISDVRVNEVIPLDSVFEQEAKPVIGLVFLSRWVAPESEQNAIEAPSDLWFANQISTFSCATVALMNVLNNQEGLQLGPHLNQFKSDTLHMSSKDRGHALDDFRFVKDLHNSFSRNLDQMLVDLTIKEEAQAAAKRSAPRKRKGQRRTKRAVSDEEENGFHFIAYVPTGGRIWKLDGTQARPISLGSLEPEENWLTATVQDIQIQLENAEASGLEFSLLSLIHEEAQTLSNEDIAKVSRLKEDWSPFIAYMLEVHAERGDIESLLA